ncbi:MAG TPA: alpha/beta fold hydrolase [Pyrinomonadaceae bacterium]
MVAARTTNPWLLPVKPNPRASLRLFVYPYAGGGAHVYRDWGGHLPPFVEVFALQYPGRGPRLLEPPFTDVWPLVECVAAALLPHLDKPYAFFGHSMGALVSFEVARRLRREHGLAPSHLFVSGSSGPQHRRKECRYSSLPDDELIERLVRFDGAPKELLGHKELMALMLPTIRADFAACEDYVYAPEPLLDCPIMALGGLADREPVPPRLEGWRDETAGRFELRMFEGGHFFIHTAHALLLRHVSHQLEQTVRSFA